MHRLQQPQPAMGLSEVISVHSSHVDALCQLRCAALQSFCVYNVLVYTEASVCMSGMLSSLSETMAGLHVPTPVHSFVRSVSMDTWQEEQIKRMQVSPLVSRHIRSHANLYRFTARR